MLLVAMVAAVVALVGCALSVSEMSHMHQLVSPAHLIADGILVVLDNCHPLNRNALTDVATTAKPNSNKPTNGREMRGKGVRALYFGQVLPRYNTS